MGIISAPLPVKLFFAMLSNEVDLFDVAVKALSDSFGPVDIESAVWSWDHTRYYEKEMGSGLKRKFVFFKNLINPGDIAGTKIKANNLEDQYLSASGGRRINLDPGYLDSAKLVLASTKDFSHKIYLGNGIYGEVTMYHAGGSYQFLPYTFPDYKSPEYLEVFNRARMKFKKDVKNP